MKKVLKAVILMIITLTLVASYAYAAIPKQEQAKSEYLLAEKLYNQKDYDGAIEHVEKARTLLGKSNWRIEYLLTKAYFSNGDYDKALKSANAFFELPPESESASEQYNEMVALYAEIERENSKMQQKIELEEKKIQQNRGGLIDNGDGTVTDPRSGLMWAAKDNGKGISWASAKTYCENYKAGGYSDWRMPTQDELAGLYDETIENKYGYHLSYLINLTSCCPWASETRGSTHFAIFGFGSGTRTWGSRSSLGYDHYRALPVRSGK